VLHDGVAKAFRAPQLIIANGALERPSPIPGWTLPGVMNAGAAQIAMKTDALVPDVPVVLAGGGPLLLLVACQLLDAGARLAALVETPSAGQRLRALPHLAGALRHPAYLLKGLTMVARLRRAGVAWHRAATELAVTGEDRTTGLQFTAGRRHHRVEAGLVLLHHGVIPNTQIARLLRLEHRWSDERLAWEVMVDAYGQTSLPGVRMAGDGTAIAGAGAAALSGELAALGAAQALGRLDTGERDRLAGPLQRALKRERAVRPFLDTLYRPPAFITHPPDAVVVCRCEEVTAGRIREMARLGCQGPNQTKFFSRCGMGPCQGRVCGTVVTQVLAEALGKPEAEVGAYRIRAPIKPVPLGALAAMADGDGGPTGH
jgi:NADPH-dependent 2,4-dienoyl-CoA reductase/sulfur reductase-like enzyme